MSIQILIVDDELMTRMTLAGYLRDYGYTVKAVSSAREAIQYQQITPYEICIVDIRMPGIDGVETIRQLHTIEKTTRYIIYTGSPQFKLPPNLRATGLREEHIVHKPILDMGVFVELIKSLLSMSDSSPEMQEEQ